MNLETAVIHTVPSTHSQVATIVCLGNVKEGIIVRHGRLRPSAIVFEVVHGLPPLAVLLACCWPSGAGPPVSYYLRVRRPQLLFFGLCLPNQEFRAQSWPQSLGN